jgi:hypothetical protein
VTKTNGATKICTDPECPHKGQPQPEENFQRNHRMPDGRLNTCKACMSRRIIAARKKKRDERRKIEQKQARHGRYSVPDVVAKKAAEPADPYIPEPPAAPTAPPTSAETAPPSNGHNFVVVDFDGHQELLDGLRLKAKESLRTPENMLLYLVKQCVERIDALDRGQ